MSEVLDDLRKARQAAIENRRTLACSLKGVWTGEETHETLQNLALMQQVLEAIEAAIDHEEKSKARTASVQELRL
jgi:hypothetical protein